MISAFNSVYTALQGFFSRGFWFAGFLPVALFAVVHLVIAIGVTGPIRLANVTLSFDMAPADLTTVGPVMIVALIVAAYAVQPLMPHFRGLLDGSQLPAWLHQWLRPQRLAFARQTRKLVKDAFDDVGAVGDLRDDAHRDTGMLRTAYQQALTLGAAADETAVREAESALTTLRDALSTETLLAPLATSARDAVLHALARNNPDPTAPQIAAAGPVGVRIATATNAVADDLEELLNEATREAIYRHNVLRTRNRVVGALDAPRATLVGDARFVAESYPALVYGVDFEFLWPRLLVAIRAAKSDDPLLSAIESARTQVDFAVLSVFLAASVPVVWMPFILLHGRSAWWFLAIGVLAPPLLGFFYSLVFEAQLAFGEIAKTAIDQSRFLVLKMLRQPEPMSRDEERFLWQRITGAEADARTANLNYVSPAPARS